MINLIYKPIYFICLIATIAFFSCNTNTKNANINPLSIIDKSKTTYYNSDSIELNPFEFFGVVEFQRIDEGMVTNLLFKTLDTIQPVITEAGDKLNLKSLDEIYISEAVYKTSNDEAEIKIVSNGNIKLKKLKVGERYKMIYAYQSDSEFHRLDPASDDIHDGYYIVDIVPVGDKLAREFISLENVPNTTKNQNNITDSEGDKKASGVTYYNNFNGQSLKDGERILKVYWRNENTCYLKIDMGECCRYCSEELIVPKGKKWILIYIDEDFTYENNFILGAVPELIIDGQNEVIYGRQFSNIKKIHLAKARDENYKYYSGSKVKCISSRRQGKLAPSGNFIDYIGTVWFLEVNE